jgi:DNA-binding transcriptional regulator YiaG
MTKTDYRYDDCGLDNVILINLTVIEDDNGDECVHIPYVAALHNEILRGIVAKESAILPKELRFIRTELGLTQAQMAERLGKDGQTIGRWERGEFPIEKAADILIRINALEYLGGQCDMPSMEVLARRSVPSINVPPIKIDASNPQNYKLLDAA